MEIFNTIWMAISTPNEGLVNLIVFFGIFIENFLFLKLLLTLLETTYTRKQQFFCILLMSIVSIINMQILPNPFNLALNYFGTVIITYLVFKTSLLKTSICVILSGILFNIVGIFLLNPYIRILHINSTDLMQIPFYRILYMFLMYSVFLVLPLIFKQKNFKIQFLDNIDKNTKLILIVTIILGTITIAIQSVIMFYYINNLPILISFFNFISSLAYFGISIYSLTKTFKLVSTTQKLQSAEAYNDTLHILHDNVRGFKHDFDNIVTTIGGYIRTDDMEGLKKYYLQLEDDCQRVNNLYILNPDIIKNDGIYNLLTKKYNEADSKDIKVNITVLLDLSTLKMKIYEFARILGILLDNAIEASDECKEKTINITFRNDTRNTRQLIIIENTYKNKEIDTEKIFEKGVSEKENHTGLGLWEVRKIIKKNNNANLFTSKTDKFFSQQLEIYEK